MSRKKMQISELDLSKIGHRIAMLRLKEGFTQDKFAEITGLTKSNISGLENHKYEPSARAIIKFVELFGVSADWILFGEDADKSSKSPKKKDDNSSQKRIIIEHQDVIKKFKDPQKAKEFNEFLVGVEKHNPEGYDNLYGLAKSLYDVTPEQKHAAPGPKKKQGQPVTKRRANGK